MNTAKNPQPTIEDTPIEGLKIINPKFFPDERGWFSEAYNIVEWKERLGFSHVFMQDSHSWSKFGVVRGLHAQKSMGKLVTCLSGSIYDVAIDVRPGSATFGQKYGIHLNGQEKKSFWIPPGFLHGFQCTSKEGADVYYKCSAVYDGPGEYAVNPLDKTIAIEWPYPNDVIMSEKDEKAQTFEELVAKQKQGIITV